MRVKVLMGGICRVVLALITVALGGCVMWPGKTTYTTPDKPGEIKERKSHRATVIEKLGTPHEETHDRRLALYEYTRTQRLHSVFPLAPFAEPQPFPVYKVDEFDTRFVLLVIYDDNDVVQRLAPYKCRSRYAGGDPVCRTPTAICGVLIEIGDAERAQRYCDAKVAKHFHKVAQVESLRQPLRTAVERKDLEAVQRLIDQGADIHAPGEPQRTPLLLVAIRRGQIPVAELLLDEGADVNAMTRFAGRSALELAVKGRHTGLVKKLLAKGASVNAGSRPPLYAAVANGDVEIARLLISAGADVDAGSPSKTPLHLAVKREDREMAKILIAAGANVAAAPGGKTALFRAVERGDQAMTELLIASGARVDVRDPRGRTPLHVAAARAPAHLAELLIATGADVNAADAKGNTPLQFSKRHRNKATTRLLERYGANE